MNTDVNTAVKKALGHSETFAYMAADKHEASLLATISSQNNAFLHKYDEQADGRAIMEISTRDARAVFQLGRKFGAFHAKSDRERVFAALSRGKSVDEIVEFYNMPREIVESARREMEDEIARYEMENDL